MASFQGIRQLISDTWKRNVRYWESLNFHKVLYFFHILTGAERRLVVLLSLIMAISGIGLLGRLYYTFTAAVPRVGATYVEGALREPHTVNPVFASQDTDRDISRLVFSGLFFYNGEGILEPDLAESYAISPDGKIYSVTLRPGLKWHDGKPLTSDDVIFTIQTIQNPQYKSVLRANWQGVTMEKRNDRTVFFTLRAPYSPFIENLTVDIIPKHLWGNVSPDQAFLHELNLKPIGSGPYMFDSMRQETNGSITWYRLKRNPHYYRDGPYLDNITFNFFRSEDDMFAALRKGTIDGFGPVSANRLLELNPQKVSVIAIPMPRIFGIFFNQQKSDILADQNVRRAIAIAINRRDIAQKAASGGGIPSEYPLPLVQSNTETQNTMYPFDPDQARQLLAQSGWSDKNGDGILEKQIGSGRKAETVKLRFTLTTSDWPDLMRAADLIKDMLNTVGIDVTVQPYSISELETKVLKPRNYELLLFGQVYGYEEDPFAFWHSSQAKDPGLNIALYTSKRADSILEKTRAITDPRERKKEYEELALILERDLPATFIYSQLYLYLLPPNIQGINLDKISLPADRFNEINAWYAETKRVFRF